MMLCAAMTIACSPVLQKRLIVTAGTVTGRPARIATWRAMFRPVVPSFNEPPKMTSSISDGSSPSA